MKTILVEVCVCTQCVAQGAMNLMESVESLKKFKYQLRHNVKVVTESKILMDEDNRHHHNAPVVRINGELLEQVSNQELMEHIVQLVRQVPPKS